MTNDRQHLPVQREPKGRMLREMDNGPLPVGMAVTHLQLNLQATVKPERRQARGQVQATTLGLICGHGTMPADGASASRALAELPGECSIVRKVACSLRNGDVAGKL